MSVALVPDKAEEFTKVNRIRETLKGLIHPLEGTRKIRHGRRIVVRLKKGVQLQPYKYKKRGKSASAYRRRSRNT